MLKIHNPATGQLIAEVPSASPELVAERARAARLAQPAWRALPMQDRLEVIQRFRVAIAAEVEPFGRGADSCKETHLASTIGLTNHYSLTSI
jgi:acyl-CoA reductase-like NAD-dependent aldehyde dehydrogenase